MRVQAIARFGLPGWKARNVLAASVVATATVAAVGALVAYLLWPTWPKSQVALDAPAIPVIVAGVLFNVPPAAVRAKMQRQPGAYERMDLVFLWPSLTPPSADSLADIKLPAAEDGEAAPAPRANDRLFLTITRLGAVLAPLVRLRTIYPRYIRRRRPPGRTVWRSSRSAPVRPMRVKTLSTSPMSRSSFSRSARGRYAACRAPAFRSARWTLP